MTTNRFTAVAVLTTDTGSALLHGLRAATVGALLLGAACAAPNPQTPTPIITPAAQAAPPPQTIADLGTPSATFSFLPSEPIRMSGVGMLKYQGRHYHFGGGGYAPGRRGASPGPMVGSIYNLTALRDFNGMYNVTPSSNGKEVVLVNPQGVSIHLPYRSGVEKDLTLVKLTLMARG